MWQDSPERPKIVEAEFVPADEGRMCVIAMRDGIAPPGSRTASRVKGSHWNPGGPAGAIALVGDGDRAQGTTGVPGRAEAGSRTGP